MNFQKIAIASLVSTIYLFLIDYLWYGVIMKDAMEGDTYMREGGPDFMWLVISYIIFSVAFVSIYTKAAGSGSKVSEGVNFGVWTTVLVSLSMGLMWYAISTMTTLSETLMDVGYSLVKFVILGVIVAHLATDDSGERGKMTGGGERGKMSGSGEMDSGQSGAGERGKMTGSGE